MHMNDNIKEIFISPETNPHARLCLHQGYD